MALLVARGDEAGADVHADVRLPEPVAEHGRAAAVGRDAQHAAVVLADRRRLLSAFRDDELAAGREPERAGELAHVGGLCERVGEQLVHVGLAVAVRVAQPPDAVAVEDVNLLVANRERHRLVQAGGEAFPADGPAGSWRPRTSHTSPSSVTLTPVPSSRNWMSPGRTLRRQGLSSGSAMWSTT